MLPYTFALERRLESRWYHKLLTPILSVIAALVASGVFLAIQGFSPLQVYTELFKASFTSAYGITDSLAVAIPLVLTGLAAAVVFRMNLFNIGAEGQLYAGAIAGAWAGLRFGEQVSGPVAIALVLCFGALGGMLLALPMAWTKAYLGTSEIISSLMLTFVALNLMRYLIFGSNSMWRDPEATNFPQGLLIPEAAQFETWGSYRVHWGLAVAVAVAVVIWLLLRFTSVGYEMDVVGSSPGAAVYAGISGPRMMALALCLSGALGGLAGGMEVAGRAHALDPNGLELGLGFTGIVVAALARNNPLAVLVVAVFLGGIRNAGLALQTLPGDRVPAEISLMLQGAILLFAIGGEVFTQNRLRVRSKARSVDGSADAAATPVAADGGVA